MLHMQQIITSSAVLSYSLLKSDKYWLYAVTVTPWLVVRKRTIPTERPPLVSEDSANFCG
jgi:hypothetical protein